MVLLKMTEQGTVIKANSKFATIKIERHSGCAHCTHAEMCGLSSGKKYATIEAPNAIDAKVGDRVNVQIEGGSATKTATLAYLFPLLAGLLFFVLSYLLTWPEWAMVLSFVVGVAMAYLITALIFRRLKNANSVKITFVEVQNEQT